MTDLPIPARTEARTEDCGDPIGQALRANLGALLAQRRLSNRDASLAAGQGHGWVSTLLDPRRESCNPNLAGLAALARVLGVSVAQLIGEDQLPLGDSPAAADAPTSCEPTTCEPTPCDEDRP